MCSGAVPATAVYCAALLLQPVCNGWSSCGCTEGCRPVPDVSGALHRSGSCMGWGRFRVTAMYRATRSAQLNGACRDGVGHYCVLRRSTTVAWLQWWECVRWRSRWPAPPWQPPLRRTQYMGLCRLPWGRPQRNAIRSKGKNSSCSLVVILCCVEWAIAPLSREKIVAGTNM